MSTNYTHDYWLLVQQSAHSISQVMRHLGPPRSLRNICIPSVLSVTEMFENMLIGTILKSVIPACIQFLSFVQKWICWLLLKFVYIITVFHLRIFHMQWWMSEIKSRETFWIRIENILRFNILTFPWDWGWCGRTYRHHLADICQTSFKFTTIIWWPKLLEQGIQMFRNFWGILTF